MLSDSTHLLFVLSVRGHTNVLKACHEWIFESRQDILYYKQKVGVLGEYVKIFHMWRLAH